MHIQTIQYCVDPENIQTQPMDGHWKFRGGGGPKARIFKGKHEAKLDFPEGRGGGVKPKKNSLGIGGSIQHISCQNLLFPVTIQGSRFVKLL